MQDSADVDEGDFHDGVGLFVYYTVTVNEMLALNGKKSIKMNNLCTKHLVIMIFKKFSIR